MSVRTLRPRSIVATLFRRPDSDALVRARTDVAVPSWIEATLITALSRVVALVELYVASARVGWLHLDKPPGGPGLLSWDAAWYRWIIDAGYHATPIAKLPYGPGYVDYAFFPLWPGLVKVLTLGDPSRVSIALPLLANLAFVVAAVLIHRVGERAFGRTIARWGLLFFAFGPSMYVFSLGYSEPLFLLVAATFFLARFRYRPALGGLGMLSRLSGGLLAMAGVADLLVDGMRRRGLAIIAGVVASFALWWTVIAIFTGDPVGYMKGTPSWYDNGVVPGRHETGPLAILDSPHEQAKWVGIFLIVFLVGSIAVIWSGRGVISLPRWLRRGTMGWGARAPRSAGQRGSVGDRYYAAGTRAEDIARDRRLLRLELGLFSLGCLGSAMLATWTTMPRLASVGFPAFFGLAAILPGWKTRLLVLLGLAVLGAYFTSQAMTAQFTP